MLFLARARAAVAALSRWLIKLGLLFAAVTNDDKMLLLLSTVESFVGLLLDKPREDTLLVASGGFDATDDDVDELPVTLQNK